ncbi:MAG: creatininase family protein [Chloroflexi bacterium]|nr:creatininase family protein [Chloroflexota bacterium]
MNTTICYGDLTYLEIQERAQSGWLAVIPTGCTEQQGPHLPVDADTWLAEQVCLNGAARATQQFGVQCLVLPTLPFGPTPEHRHYGSGFIDIPQILHEKILRAMLESLATQGFSRLVIWRGCGQHELAETIRIFNAAYVGTARVFQPDFPHYGIWCRHADPNIPGGHADSYMTSLMMHLRPQAVRLEQIRNPHSLPVDWEDPDLDFAHHSKTGVIGDPTHASAGLGARLWEDVQDSVAQTLRDIAQSPVI